MSEPRKRVFNEHMVGEIGDGQITIVNPPRGKISPEQAVNLALWLCIAAKVDPDKFAALVKEVKTND